MRSLSKATGCTILGKAEYLNPGGCVKDRAAKYLIDYGEKQGLLKKNGWLVEATAGNTGIGLCHVANERGYRCLFIIPTKMSDEKVRRLEDMGAIVERSPMVGRDDPAHFQNASERRAKELGGYLTNQFNNLANTQAHYATTGPELWKQTNQKLDAFICSCGTGGTISGTSKYLKEQSPNVKCYLINPCGVGVKLVKNDKGENVLAEKTPEEKEKSEKSILEGVGSAIVYGNLTAAKLDGTYQGSDDEAVKMCHYLLKNDGLFVGGSAALNVVGAVLVARLLGPGHTIATILCDGGDRYRSKIYNAAWLKENNFDVSNLASDLSWITSDKLDTGA